MDPEKNKLSTLADGAPGNSGRAALKRPYTTPRLVEYGSIAKLTQSIGTRNGDGGQQMRTAMG